MIKKLFMNILNYGADPRSLDGMSRLRCTIEITLPAKDLGSVRGCTNSGQPHWSLVVQLVLDAMPVGSTQVRVKPGETYRQPQATSFKLDNRSGIV